MKIYVSTYAKYNAGSLTGAWLTLTDYNNEQDFLTECYNLHDDEIDHELMFQDFDDVHKNYQDECVNLTALYEYIDACNNNDKSIIDAGLDCEIPLESIMDAYQGQYDSDEDFAYDYAESCGVLNKNDEWPYNCIDWSIAARDLMFDFTKSNNHYFYWLA